MKYLTIIISLLTWFTDLKAQDELYKTWVSQNLEYLKIERNKVTSNLIGGYDAQFEFDKGDSCINVYFTSNALIKRKKKNKKKNDPDLCFVIEHVSKDSLILVETTGKHLYGFLTKRSIFISQEKCRNPGLQFETIYFSAIDIQFSLAMMHPTYKIQIDSSGLVVYKKMLSWHENDSTTLFAYLNDQQMDTLNNLLKDICLDKMPEQFYIVAAESPLLTLIIASDQGKIIGKGYYPPYFVRPLERYITSLRKNLQYSVFSPGRKVNWIGQ